MNIILAAHPSRVVGGGVVVGRNRFFHPSPMAPPVSLGGGLEAWRGFYTSVRPSWKQLMVNVNVCTTAFYTPGNLAEKMVEFMAAAPSGRLASFVRGVRVKTTHLGYRKTAKTVAKVNARQHRFEAEGMGLVTVEEYFLKSKSHTSMIWTDFRPVVLTMHRVQYQAAVSRPSSHRRRRTEAELPPT